MSSKISVIVPVYNTSVYLKDVIEALLAQDFDTLQRELIFIDNGSTDDSREILHSYPELTVLTEPQKGSYAARNKGILSAKGDIFAFIDSDCYPTQTWLSAIEANLKNGPVGVLMGARLPARDERALRLIADYENCKAELIFNLDDPSVYFGYTNNMAVKRSTMEAIGPFEQRARGADTIFVRQVVESAGTHAVKYCPDMVVRHAELESVAAYYRKMGIYAHARQAYRHITSVRALSLRERLAVFLRVTEASSLWDSMFLFLLLSAGVFAWWRGGLNVPPSDQ
jgi:glycosyltransferase involved in cell wall biosynthesis